MATPGKLVEILQVSLPGQSEDINGLQHPKRSHIAVQSGRLQGSSQSGCVAGRSLLWTPWTETFASVGLVWAEILNSLPGRMTCRLLLMPCGQTQSPDFRLYFHARKAYG